MTDRPELSPTIECCLCGWSGGEEERPLQPSESLRRLGVAGLDHVCQRCGHDTFYTHREGAER